MTSSLHWPGRVSITLGNRTVDASDSRFERTVGEHGAALSRLAAAYASDAADRDDLLQDILFALWRALPSFRGECTERAFVLRVAHNRALTHRHRRRTPLPLEAAERIADPAPDPGAQADSSQRHARLMTAVRILPPAPRQVAMLYLEGLSNLEIAEVLGITANNVGIRLMRAREKLRELLGEPDAEDRS
jgi:RNA polymerase sigma-70 factor (ECF subfamily)